jgi:hypothetical protein
MIPLDESVSGPTRKTSIQQLAVFLNAFTGTFRALWPTYHATTSGGTISLDMVLPNGGTLFVHNGVATVAIVPWAVPAEGTFVTIVDAAKTAATYNITFQGTLGNVSDTNPVLIENNGTWATLQASAGSVWRVG